MIYRKSQDNLKSGGKKMLRNTGPEIVTINSTLIDEDQLRLDAAYYGKNSRDMETAIRKSGYDIKTLGDLTELRYLGRFKRIWQSDDTGGSVPYLSASETLSFKPLRERYISQYNIKNPERYFVKQNWILVECSGTIGVPIYVNKTLEKYFLDNHLLRLIPKEGTLPGYVYAYLYSKYGQSLLKRGQYGSVVKEIDPRQVGPIPIPMLPARLQQKIHEKIVKASDLRYEANKLEYEAIRMLEENLSSDEKNYPNST